MKNPIKKSLLLSCMLAGGLSLPAGAQPASPFSPSVAPAYPANGNYGLLGTTYAGADFGYTHKVEGSGGIGRRYGFVYNQPLPEGVDFNFNYDYFRNSEGRRDIRAHALALGLTGYLPQSWGKPFLNGDVGWAWKKTGGGSRDNAFFYKIKVGVELQLAPALVLTPYAYFKEAPDFSERAWHYGASSTYRFNPRWSGSLGAEMDEKHNIEYVLGVKYHY